jgi:hypothetical protein
MKSGGKDPSVSSTYLFFFREHGSDIRVTTEELLRWLTRWSIVRFPVDNGHVPQPSQWSVISQRHGP